MSLESYPVEVLLDTARDALAKDMLGLSEGLCYRLAQQGVHTFDVFSVLARSYDQLGMRVAAGYAAQAALKLSPDSLEMTALLGKAGVQEIVSPEPRFLVIKAWGCGFWSDVAHVLGCLLICELTGRIPVTDWGLNSHFADGSGEDAYRLFFEPVSAYTARDLVAYRGPLFPKTWDHLGVASPPLHWDDGREHRSPLYFLNRPETIAVCDFHAAVSELAVHIPASHPMAGRSIEEIYRYLAMKYLVPRADIKAAAMAFFDAHIAGSRSVAVHLRGSDKATELLELDHLNHSLLDAVEALDPACRLFVLSDDQRWIDRAVQRFGDRVISTPHHRTSTDIGVHLMKEKRGEALGREVLIDCCIALACDRFIGGGFSNVAAMIDALKPWPEGASRLLGRSIFRNTHINTYAMAFAIKNSAP